MKMRADRYRDETEFDEVLAMEFVSVVRVHEREVSAMNVLWPTVVLLRDPQSIK